MNSPVTTTVHSAVSTGLRDQWADLASSTASLSSGPDWVLAAHRHLGAGRPVVVAAHREDRLVGLVALSLERVAGYPVLRFLGHGPSDYGTVLLADGAGADVTGALLDAAVAHVGRRVVLDLAEVSDLDPLGPTLAAWARSRGRRVRALQQSETSRCTYEPADTGDSKNRRTKDRKTLRRLNERGAAQIVGDLLPDPSGLPELLAELRAVDDAHPNADRRNRPWNGANGEFLAEFLRTAPAGSRWLTGLRLDGRLVAYSMELITPAAVGMYLCSYRAEVADVGVGTLLLHDVRRRARGEGADVLDLLRGLEPYKARLATSEHVNRRLVAAAPGPGVLTLPFATALTWRQTLRPHVRRARERLARK